jgi:hypothetical protein
VGLGNSGALPVQFYLSRKKNDDKKDLALVAAAVLRCGLASGYSEAEILAVAKQTAPSKDPAWLAALAKAARSNKHVDR